MVDCLLENFSSDYLLKFKDPYDRNWNIFHAAARYVEFGDIKPLWKIICKFKNFPQKLKNLLSEKTSHGYIPSTSI